LAAVLFSVAIMAGMPGFGGIAGAAATIAQILFFIFIAALLSDWRGCRPPGV